MVGAFGEVHLMDWGLARISPDPRRIPIAGELPSSSTILSVAERLASRSIQADAPAGTIWGTPAYMAPEQARGQGTDVRSDVFGLGGILCEILTGHPPHNGRSLIDVCFRAATGDLSLIFQKLSECDADGVLIRLARNCLAPEADLRPAHAGIVAKELTLYLESMLERAETDLRRFFDLSLDLFCIAGLDGFFRRVNSNFSRVLGYKEKSLLSRPFLDFVHPDDRAGTIEVMRLLLEGRPVVQFQNRYQTESGSWRRFEWTAKSIPDEGIIFAVARDVTEQLRRAD
jgi:serine/threonine-protein kinase